jgi:SAM-dependent methyltransferase
MRAGRAFISCNLRPLIAQALVFSFITMVQARSSQSPPSNSEPLSRKRQKRDEKLERSKKRKLEQKKESHDKTTEQLSADDASEWSRSKKKRMRAMKAKMNKRKGNEGSEAASKSQIKQEEEQTVVPSTKTPEKLSSPGLTLVPNNAQLRAAGTTTSSTLSKYQARLQGSRFRILNEELYTMHSQKAFEQFSSQPQLFEDYHTGFASQVEHWPVQPVVVVAEELKRLVATDKNEHHSPKIIAIKDGSKQLLPIVIADFGCGKAELAQDLLKVKIPGSETCPFRVHSFDLVASSDLVTACDMSKTPLASGTVDVAVFCLSLMGNNLADFIREAHRVLKPTGTVKIVEVRSRFETTVDADVKSNSQAMDKKKQNKKHKSNDTAVDPKPITELKRFLNALEQLGFECVNLDRSNKMFFVLDLRKNGKVPDSALEFTAKPCIYKRR